MAIPLLNYAPKTQNARVAGEVPGDDQPRIYSAETLLSGTDMDDLIEAGYRQIFFHAFKSDREPFLESQLRSGQITVRDFVRGLLLSDTYNRSFYDLNSNYRFVEHCVQRVLGRDIHGEGEKLAWSIVVATKGREGFIDELLNSDEYLDNFGYDILPYQRRRVLPGRATGEVPFNVQTPRYNEYYRTILGFPKMVYMGAVKAIPKRIPVAPGNPDDYLELARAVKAGPRPGGAVALESMDYMSKVPYRRDIKAA